jgi:DNA-binding NtrC family response regulator
LASLAEELFTIEVDQAASRLLDCNKKSRKVKIGRQMSGKAPRGDDSKIDQAVVERPECEHCHRDLRVLLAGREVSAKAMISAHDLTSGLSAFVSHLAEDDPAHASNLHCAAQAIQPCKSTPSTKLLATADDLVSAPGGDLSIDPTIDELGEDICMVVASPAMHRLRQRAELVAKEMIPVLILGESGTGKEVTARFIHSRSPRSARPFLKVNCAALPSGLLESELFGYEQGAFTGATSAKPGKFEQCSGGSILLDEIGEMSTGLQAKLLQVLHDKSFSRLGSRKEMKVDVRIMAATNIDLQRALADGTLREDLYYRLNGVTLQVPPLRERKEDIPVLLEQLGARLAERYACPLLEPSQRLIEACLKHSWPGNIRELVNFVKRRLILRDEEALIEELRDSAHAKPISAPSRKPLKRIRRRGAFAKDLSGS